ncbi:hypothetical protein PCC82_11250 [Agrobacterium deltaense]
MSDDLNLDDLDDLVRRYVFSANFDGDAAEERREIHKWVNEAILAERQRLARQVYDATFDDDILKIRRMMHDILA